MAIQLRISRAQHEEPRLGRVFPIEEDYNAQATLKRLVPHHSGIQMHMRFLWPRAEVLEPVQGLEVDLPIIFAPCPTSLRVRTGIEKHTVSVAPQFGDGVQMETNDFIYIFLLRIVAIHAMIADARRQAMPMRTQLLLVEVDPRVFRLRLCGLLARRRLRNGECESGPVCDIHHRERRNLQPAFGTTRTAVEEVPETERLLTALWNEGRVMRRDQFRTRVECHQQYALMKVGPVKWLPELPCDSAFRIVTVTTQVTEVDATAQHKDRDEQRGQELSLRLPEPGYLFQDVVDHCHKPCTGSSGVGCDNHI